MCIQGNTGNGWNNTMAVAFPVASEIVRHQFLKTKSSQGFGFGVLAVLHEFAEEGAQ